MALSSPSYLRTYNIMDYVVDIQGFRDARRQFLPKEVAVIAFQKDIVSHCIVQAPCYFYWLPSDVETRNSYCSAEVHGLQWIEAARKIYVCGEEKVSYLKDKIERSIINLEYYHSPSFNKLESLFPNTSVLTHLQKHVENKNNFCVLFKTRFIKSWLYTILPEEW